jgi:ribonucleoside-diphosphate reductase alpha chain
MSETKSTTVNVSKKITTGSGFKLKRIFTKKDVHPYDEISWVKSNAQVGKFEQKDVEFPDFWSENAVNITASKYFRGKLNTPARETTLKQVINRVTKTIRKWGEDFGYFESKIQAQIFEDELTHLLVNQKASFNSPVWFNVGAKKNPQCSACFILSVEDDMSSILEWIRTEGIIFKGGSGAGINVSPLRSKLENLSGGGYSSGPVSFMRGADAVAGMIKSGGTTRRAAKMVVMNIDHPDVLEFIRCKAEEERKVRAFMDAGYDMSDLNNDAWTSIQFQNANNSVRITDEFMKAAETDGEWQTKFRLSDETAETYKAREVLSEIAKAAWESGDPGVQFDTTINDWHTCPASGRINASNPCSEYMHLDDSACNLASINLLKFLDADGTFKTREFKQAVRVFILAQDIIVEGSSYPTEKIARNARDFRELGLGFANLGALLMTRGFAYDSEEARSWAGAISSLIGGEAYRYSAEVAGKMKPFKGYEINREPMLRVIKKHREASLAIDDSFVDDKALIDEARHVWDEALKLGEEQGFRNSQVTVIAPTGTIAFMMDCATTGIEPDFSLIKMKQLVGGGWMKIVNEAVPQALLNLGYSPEEVGKISAWIKEHGAVESAPHIKEEHLAVFDTAVKPKEGKRSISWRGHVRMVSAVQPFISGAISKTFNMPHETTQEEIQEAYAMAWKLGIKAFAVYRDGSKQSQPLQTEHSKSSKKQVKSNGRERLPDTRKSETHKFVIAGHDGFMTYSTYEDGRLAEIFIRMAKQGSTLAGLLDSFALAISISLQYGVPLKVFANKYIRSRFEPAGYTANPDIMVATSIVDYLFRYLALKFLPQEDLMELGLTHIDLNGNGQNGGKYLEEGLKENYVELANQKPLTNGYVYASTVCKKCGGMMVQSGSCYTCLDCGETSGGCS